ncbi:uncharacterized protein METZ01_LOCUS53885 [marine metagenome]|uniref:Uncharacterized protein n=1 Tax=marine metagenome TaxID=408172 RepID=A0A381SCJ6_9ZZZZ
MIIQEVFRIIQNIQRSLAGLSARLIKRAARHDS